MSQSLTTPALLRKGLLRQLFSGACMQRWNDKLRPCHLAELDKQGHKMLVANLLWSRTCRPPMPSEQDYALAREIIEGALFDYLYRTVITDIKPPLFYRIQEKQEHYARLTDYVISTLAPVLSPLEGFWERFQLWHRERDSHPQARSMLRAAHLFASRWEFQLIAPLNGFDREIPAIAATMERELQELCPKVTGLADILDQKKAIGHLASFCGQLRFQVRWTQVPRIPSTSVLGHMFLVGSLAYLFTLTFPACDARLVNNFFCGLYHDLPELLTRDIISPVKQSSSELARLIRACEDEELRTRILDPLERAGEEVLVRHLRYYLGLDAGSEFSQRVFLDGEVLTIPDFAELHRERNSTALHPVDGHIVKACDLLGAYLEAYESIMGGISSRTLTNALFRLTTQLLDTDKVPQCMHMDSLLADFD